MTEESICFPVSQKLRLAGITKSNFKQGDFGTISFWRQFARNKSLNYSLHSHGLFLSIQINMVNFNKTIFLKISLAAVLLFGFLGVIASRFPTKPYKGQAEISVETIHPVKSDSVETDTPLRDSLEQFGKGFLGVPYVYGGTSGKGFDCSGFVFYVYKEFGINVPRTSAQFADFGKEVPIETVKKGDILVFLSPTRNAIGHIGIVTNAKGMESEFIHASSSKEMKVMISSLKQPSYTRRFVKAVTVLENKGMANN